MNEIKSFPPICCRCKSEKAQGYFPHNDKVYCSKCFRIILDIETNELTDYLKTKTGVTDADLDAIKSDFKTVIRE